MTLVWATAKSISLHRYLHSYVQPGRAFLRPGLTSHQRRAQGRSRRPAGHCTAARRVLEGPEHGASIPGRTGRGGQRRSRFAGRTRCAATLYSVGRREARTIMQSSASATRLRAAVPIWKAVLEPCHVTGARHLGFANRQTELFACPLATMRQLPWHAVGRARPRATRRSSPSATAQSGASGRARRS